MLGSSTSMARKTTKGAQVHPKGGVITLSPEQRKEVHDLRLAAGLTQLQLADRVNTTNGTISNMETGASKQTNKQIYAKVLRVLRRAKSESAPAQDADEDFVKTVDALTGLDGFNMRTVLELAKRLGEKQAEGAKEK